MLLKLLGFFLFPVISAEILFKASLRSSGILFKPICVILVRVSKRFMHKIGVFITI